jgi:hypothetical protein
VSTTAVATTNTKAGRFGGPQDDRAVVRVDDAYLSLTKGLPAYSGLSERTLRGYLCHPSHPLPCYRIGGKVLVRRSEFDRWAEQFRAVEVAALDALVSHVVKGLG